MKHIIKAAANIKELGELVKKYENKEYEVAGLTKDGDLFIVIFKRSEDRYLEHQRDFLEEQLKQQDVYLWQNPQITC